MQSTLPTQRILTLICFICLQIDVARAQRVHRNTSRVTVGIVFGVIVVTFILICLIAILCRRRRQRLARINIQSAPQGVETQVLPASYPPKPIAPPPYAPPPPDYWVNGASNSYAAQPYGEPAAWNTASHNPAAGTQRPSDYPPGQSHGNNVFATDQPHPPPIPGYYPPPAGEPYGQQPLPFPTPAHTN